MRRVTHAHPCTRMARNMVAGQLCAPEVSLKVAEDGHVAYAGATKIYEENLVHEFIGKVADASVISRRQEPVIQKERKTVEVPQEQ